MDVVIAIVEPPSKCHKVLGPWIIENNWKQGPTVRVFQPSPPRLDHCPYHNDFIQVERTRGNATCTAEYVWYFTGDLQLSRGGKYLFVSWQIFWTGQSKWKSILMLQILMMESGFYHLIIINFYADILFIPILLLGYITCYITYYLGHNLVHNNICYITSYTTFLGYIICYIGDWLFAINQVV